ncbi:unnamed protein product, partial [Symbiodinium necroappetens]
YLALSRFAKLQAKVPSRAALALSAGAFGAGALTAKSWVQPVGCEGSNWDEIRKEIVKILDDDTYKETCLQYSLPHETKLNPSWSSKGCPGTWAKYFS